MIEILLRKLEDLTDPQDILDTITDLYSQPGYEATEDVKSARRSAEKNTSRISRGYKKALQ